MRKLRKPTDDATQVFQDCISSVRDIELRVKLQSVTEEIGTAANDYESAASGAVLHTFPQQQDIAGVVTAEEMSNVYKHRMAKSGASGRSIYDKIRASSPQGKCPLCGCRMVSTVDHHLPKSRYPALAVTPINLIPACAECNKDKSERFPQSEIEQTFNPYYDDIDSESWLNANVVFCSPAAIQYFVSTPDSWDSIKSERIRFHFRVFRLAELYATYAGEEITNIRYSLGEIFNKEGLLGVKSHLAREAQSRKVQNLNSWQAVMYTVLAESDWFCAGGFKQ